MKIVESLDHYNRMIVDIKRRCPHTVSNNYLIPDSVGYYINRGLLYYDFLDDCLLLYVDNKRYYSLYIIGDSDHKLNLEHLELPILFEVVCRAADKADIWDRMIADTGLMYKCTLEGFDYDPKDVLFNLRNISAEARSALRREKFQLISPGSDLYERIYKFVDDIPEIPYWDIAYRSESDFTDDSDKGLVRCVVNSDNEICGAYYRYVYGNNEYGWIAVNEMYRKWTGISIALTTDIMEGMIKRGHYGKGWIDYNNNSSMRYHTHIGYHKNGRIKKEYICNISV